MQYQWRLEPELRVGIIRKRAAVFDHENRIRNRWISACRRLPWCDVGYDIDSTLTY